MYYVYLIRSVSTGKCYIGSTKDVETRLKRHNKGDTKSIKYQGPFRLIYKKEFSTRKEAYHREQEIKSYKGGNAFKKLISCGAGVDNRSSL